MQRSPLPADPQPAPELAGPAGLAAPAATPPQAQAGGGPPARAPINQVEVGFAGFLPGIPAENFSSRRHGRGAVARLNARLGAADRAGAGLVRVLWRALRARGRTRAWLAEETAIPIGTLDSWRKGKRCPRVAALERCFGALDMELVAVPRPSSATPAIRAVEQGGLDL